MQFVSITSAYKIQRPDILMLHCDFLPVGPWWFSLWNDVPITVMHREPPEDINGKRLQHMNHKVEVTKILVLQQYGGIYLDYDVIVLRSFDPLRIYNITMGKDKASTINTGIIIAHKSAQFLDLWYKSFNDNYSTTHTNFECGRVTYQLFLEKPSALHVEPYKLTTPDSSERQKLWNEVIDWQGMGLFAVYAVANNNGFQYTPDNIKNFNSTVGEVMRYIHYGTPDLILD